MLKIKNISLYFIIFMIFAGCKSQSDKDVDTVKKMIDSDRISESKQLAAKCIEKYPNDVRFYYYRGYCDLKTDIDSAKSDFTKCITINPNYSNGYHGLAMIYAQESQLDLAEKNYNKAIELSSDRELKSIFMEDLSYIYEKKKDYKKAIDTIKKAIELNDLGDFYYNLGVYFAKNGQRKEAVETLHKAINEKKFKQIQFKHETYFMLASYYFSKKNYTKTKEYLEKAIALAPTNINYISAYDDLKTDMK